MAENKKYYFLKLKEDFFERREIVVLEGTKDGILYVNILLKLYLKSLQHNGKLLLNNGIPLSAEMIAMLTRHEIGTVERALQVFLRLGLAEILEDNTYYLPEILNMTGKGSSEGERKAEYRKVKTDSQKQSLLSKEDLGQVWDNVPRLSPICPPEIRDQRLEEEGEKQEPKPYPNNQRKRSPMEVIKMYF